MRVRPAWGLRTRGGGGGGGGGGGRGGGAAARQGGRRVSGNEPDDTAGFVPIFDGKTLNGWDGDTTFWRVENGEIVGETTPEKVVKQNSFLIWRGEKVRDFELKVEFRLNGTNSGIQYPQHGAAVDRQVGAEGLSGRHRLRRALYRQRPRRARPRPAKACRALAPRPGHPHRRSPKYKVVGNIGDPTLLRGVLNVNNWNRYHIIARGPVLMQFINEQLMAVAIDEDQKNAPAEGVIGLPDAHRSAVQDPVPRNVLYRKL